MEEGIIEFFIIGCIILLQSYLFFQTYKRIYQLKSAFNKVENVQILSGSIPVSLLNRGKVEPIIKYLSGIDDNVEEDESYIEIAIISTTSKDNIDYEIVSSINNYLVNNKGAVADYHLLKDIVDRHIGSLDEEVNNALPAPLYLGLAATMLGIIFGLINMPEFSQTEFDLNILSPLLDGVKIAMMASVWGLLLTTVLSIWIYKPGKVKSEKNKNKFLSFLQINLLPELIRTESSGISVLNDRLKRFDSTIKPTINELSSIVQKFLDAIRSQETILDKVEKLDSTKLVEANASILNELNQMMGSFKQFAKYYQELNRSMGQTVALTNNLQELVKRTGEVETIANNINNTFSDNKQLNEFLAQHFVDVGSKEAALRNVVDASNRKLVESIDLMKDAVRAKIKEVQEISIAIEPKLKDAFASSLNSIELMTKEQVTHLEMAFKNSRPQFDKLNKLDEIEKGINAIAIQGNKGSETQSLMIQAINDLTSTLKEDRKMSEGEVSSSNKDILIELRNLGEILKSCAIESNGSSKHDKFKTALIAINFVWFLGLIGFLTYALFTGLIL